MTWIQYDLTTGIQTGTLSDKANDSDLLSLGKGQIEYTGDIDPTLINVDITQIPPVLIIPI